MNVAQALAAAASMGLERLDSQLLLLRAVGRTETDRGWLLAHDGDFALPETAHENARARDERAPEVCELQLVERAEKAFREDGRVDGETKLAEEEL